MRADRRERRGVEGMDSTDGDVTRVETWGGGVGWRMGDKSG